MTDVVTVRPDPDAWRALLRRERVTFTVAPAVVVLAEAGTNALGLVGPVVVAHALTLVAAFWLLAALGLRRNRLAQTLGDPARAIRVSDAGVELPLLGLVPWDEVVAVHSVVDEGRIAAMARSTGVRRIAERWTVRLGSSNHLVFIGTADGPALRARAEPRRFRRWVRLWARSGAPDFGQVQLACDTFYTPDAAAELDAALRSAAAQRGLPASRSTDLSEMGEFYRTNSRIPGFDGRTLG
ncbi:hypothetical protein [Curtobacterium sp. 9128]|uniref:hypothetical protein n=1 Tax=Curtobacterium sp. 9128 TaxID=1793722 RepID=UPI0011A49D28|nr:hypothetical protein [Curtobacterium sp. 9128]